MPLWTPDLVDRALHRHAVRRWQRLAQQGSAGLDRAALRGLLTRAWHLRRPIDKFIHDAEGRMALPARSGAMRRPAGADWVWRPDPWRGRTAFPGVVGAPSGTTLGGGVAVFHDCRDAELIVRQTRNARADDLAPFGLRIDVFGFSGGYLSLAIDLPEDAVQGLTGRHLIRLDVVAETERPIAVFGCLNLRQSPNVDRISRALPWSGPEAVVDFDLGLSPLGPRRVDKAWVDLIFEAPAMNQLTLRDVTLSRRPRADL